jgi:hypothetical protein
MWNRNTLKLLLMILTEQLVTQAYIVHEHSPQRASHTWQNTQSIFMGLISFSGQTVIISQQLAKHPCNGDEVFSLR